MITAVQPTWWGTIDYQTALGQMDRAHQQLVARRDQPAKFFYLEHPPVITYGRATPPGELALGASDIPRIAVSRGGLATYHAPGQLVGYIVLDLSRRANAEPDIHAYLRAIEQGVIDFVQAEFGLEATRRDSFTGVWTPPSAEGLHPGRKLASIGVNARKWVTSHGFALNINPDMSGFDAIVPCGITDARMTSVAQEMEAIGCDFMERPMQEWAKAAHGHLVTALQQEGWLV